MGKGVEVGRRGGRRSEGRGCNIRVSWLLWAIFRATSCVRGAGCALLLRGFMYHSVCLSVCLFVCLSVCRLSGRHLSLIFPFSHFPLFPFSFVSIDAGKQRRRQRQRQRQRQRADQDRGNLLSFHEILIPSTSTSTNQTSASPLHFVCFCCCSSERVRTATTDTIWGGGLVV